jgi:hypothetical protein
VDVATIGPAALAASGATSPPGFQVWDVVHDWVQTLIFGSLGFLFVDVIQESSQKKKAAEDYERLKAQLHEQGYHPRLLARLASMPASEFYGAANSKAVDLLIAEWQAEARQVSSTAGICCLHGARLHYAGWTAGWMHAWQRHSARWP